MKKKIAIQGVHGCFHEQAARLYYGDDIDVLECLNFEDLFVGLERKEAEGAVMAIENTVAGGLLPNYALLHKYGKQIKGGGVSPDSAESDGIARTADRRYPGSTFALYGHSPNPGVF